MSRVLSWLQSREHSLFCFINQRIQHTYLDAMLKWLTHLGGATATISFSLMIALFAAPDWRIIGWQCLLTLALSHIPVAILKRIYPRLRPYLVMPSANTVDNPLTDHSFPSGHTTAIMSVAVPLSVASPPLAVVALPVAFTVGVSRIYLGLHYPSDVLAGGVIATLASIICIALIG